MFQNTMSLTAKRGGGDCDSQRLTCGSIGEKKKVVGVSGGDLKKIK